METNLKMCLDKVCRACLCESTNMRSLTTKVEGEHRTLIDVLTFVANFNVKTGNKLPNQVCNECEVTMCKADAFKRRCLESEKIINRQVYDEGHECFDEIFNKKPLVKDEINTETDKIITNQSSQCSNSLVKPLNSSVFELFGTSSHKEEKGFLHEIPLKSGSEYNISISGESGKTENKVDIVKEEEIDDFDSQNELLGMGYIETLPIEHDPIDKNKATDEVKVYSCSCGIIFNKKLLYRAHLKTNKCSGHKKSIKFTIEKKNPKGGRNITIKRQIVCPECNLEFNTIKACKVHQQKHRNVNDEDGQFECTMCMRKFLRKSSYTNHLKTHDVKNNVKYTCSTCKREFQHKAHLDNHILLVHTRDKGFTCELCTKNFSTQESLELHKESHKVEKKHKCNLCSKAFYMLSTLMDHLRTHTGEKPFLCSVCGKGFSQKTNLAQHMRRHQGLKPFKCEDCDRRFVSKGELQAHTRKHSGAHPFICDECGSGFTTSSSLVKHRRIHTGERPYPCDLCSMRFTASGTLKNHRRTHTGEKPFKCSYCDKAFVQRHDLIAHIRCHTGERPYVCGCGQSFRKASALKAHVKMHGKEPLGVARGLNAQGNVS